jgi:hypothetical protein
MEFNRDGSVWQSWLYVTNPSSTAVSCNINLFGALSPDRLSVPPNLTIAPNTWQFVTTSAKGSLASGYARLDCQLPVTASVVYNLTPANKTVAGIATVFSAPAIKATSYPVLGLPGYRTALAIVNDNDALASFRVIFTDAIGSQSGQVIQIAPRGQYVHFLDEIVGAVRPGLGTIAITSPSGLSFNATGLLFAGNTFSTLVPLF